MNIRKEKRANGNSLWFKCAMIQTVVIIIGIIIGFIINFKQNARLKNIEIFIERFNSKEVFYDMITEDTNKRLGIIGKKVSLSSSVRIHVLLENTQRENGYGTLVEIEDKFFIVTNIRVISNKSLSNDKKVKYCVLDITGVYSVDGDVIKVNKTPLVGKEKEEYIALLEVDYSSIPDTMQAVEVPKQGTMRGTKLVGAYFNDKLWYFENCEIFNVGEKRYVTDCDVSNLGIGYFDYFGKFIGISSGDDRDEENYVDRVEKIWNISKNYELLNSCVYK
jgi:hypothetical protein